MRILAAITGATLLLGLVTAPSIATAAPPAPSIQVSRTTGLSGGDQVRVTARGFAPGSEVRIVQCEIFSDNVDYDCTNNLVVTAGASGRISTRFTLLDPVFQGHEAGEPTPVYCRADSCHLFVAGTDAAGSQLVLDSGPLTFNGSPATITVTPSDQLEASQWVEVTGTAYGAQGRQVQIVEHACFEIIQDTGCYGEGTVVTTVVRSDGTYAADYLAKRFLDNGEDCEHDGNLGQCVLSVTVLTTAELPDNSFGFAEIGDQMAPVFFRTTS
jgi:hypothetical protein